jgi:hypothetical protein
MRGCGRLGPSGPSSRTARPRALACGLLAWTQMLALAGPAGR